MVSRMMSGGSAGLRTMIALPCVAPPTDSSAWAVVSVNSSMFARVPGPADAEATQGQTKVAIFVEVEGAGDYLPPYSGNLDIMTAAAAQVGENIARAIA